MGIMEDQHDTKKRPRQQNKNGAGNTIRPFTFHPTAEQRRSLRDDPPDLNRVAIDLEEWLTFGHRITLGHSDRGDGLYAVIRDGRQEWQQSQAVFVYHNDLGKALITLWYFLKHVAPEFPALPKAVAGPDDFW